MPAKVKEESLFTKKVAGKERTSGRTNTVSVDVNFKAAHTAAVVTSDEVDALRMWTTFRLAATALVHVCITSQQWCSDGRIAVGWPGPPSITMCPGFPGVSTPNRTRSIQPFSTLQPRDRQTDSSKPNWIPGELGLPTDTVIQTGLRSVQQL